MSRNEFIVDEIPGPHVMKKVLIVLGYSKDQVNVADALLKPTQFPLYVYQNPETRYWFGSNPNMKGAPPILWSEFLRDNGVPFKEIVELLESDVRWFTGKFKTVGHKIKELIGE